jgi:DNA (cytosine-5)-methyltransferase 1
MLKQPYRVLDLFSGIGGFSLGLERTGGFRTVAFCEIDPFCRRVLAKHWPEVPCYDDVRELTAAHLAADGIAVDVICGGFPCQDISFAGKGAGLAGERSGLWSEIARLSGELRPRYVIVENVAALLSRGLDKVLGDLAALGYDAEWHCIPASAVGAPHQRDRIWIVAYADIRRLRGQGVRQKQSGRAETVGSSEDVAHADKPRLERWLCEGLRECASEWTTRPSGPSVQHAPHNAEDGARARRGVPAGEWRSEPDVGRVAHGVPKRVDRLRSLGNAVVPQIPEMIGRAIMASEAGQNAP